MDKGQLLIYKTKNGKLDIQLDLENETIWLDRKGIAELFDIDRTSISRHIKNIFNNNELDEISNVQKMHITSQNKPISYRPVELFSLDVILAVGYRTNSRVATQFRKWATQTLREYIIKGFVLNSERLKDPNKWDYFDELLEQIREIRASEKRFYQKIRDLFALSSDYSDTKETQNFFAEVQNKLLYAVTNKTAAEIIITRADSLKPNMNLTSWKGSIVRKQDVIVAKNYLIKNEIKELDRLVNMFIDYAENQTEKRKKITMSDWKEKVDGFLKFNDYDILTNKGSVSKADADEFAENHYSAFDKYRKKQEAIDADNDDIKELEKLGRKNKS